MKLLAISFVATTLVAAYPASAVPERLRFQGTLTDLVAFPVEDGTYEFTVRIFDGPDPGANLQYQRTLDVDVSAGAYSFTLAPENPGDLQNAFASWPRFIEIEIKTGAQGQPINETLSPRQEVASVPFAFQGPALPIGAIILWMDSAECPPGFAEVTALRGKTIRGADRSATIDDVPEDPGEVCPGGAGCNADAARYDDLLQASEMPSHQHTGTQLGDGGTAVSLISGSTGSPQAGTLARGNPSGANSLYVNVAPEGGDAAHLHPFATVLFCRKF